ncbi:hypothetical protein PR048_031887 [Dryococelus australis]|uniref:Protein white n=1 Tax=Dryococelus australis TaxID=614101 RepID=A0ABQ9G9G4_9NEOP|nr:hypothetical protein PR048_031887 [Dryococelus australis]
MHGRRQQDSSICTDWREGSKILVVAQTRERAARDLLLRILDRGHQETSCGTDMVLTNPPLMFCDEPTSGLDAFMAQNVVSVLKSMAQKGKTVVCTIHQPSSEVFALFDKVLLMAEGRVAFLGTSQEACNFFRKLGAACPTNYNPGDFFIQLLAVIPSREEACKETIELICDNFNSSDMGLHINQITKPKLYQMEVMNSGVYTDGYGTECRRHSPYKASWCAQMRAVFWRSWLCAMKEPILIKVRVLQTIMVALVIGVVYFNQKMNQDGVMNINGALFLFLTNMTFQNLFAVINSIHATNTSPSAVPQYPVVINTRLYSRALGQMAFATDSWLLDRGRIYSVFCSELPVFLREHHNGMYRTDVYFLCKSLAEVPVFVFIPVVFTVVSYYMVGLNPAPGRIYMSAAIMTLIANVATSFGKSPYLTACSLYLYVYQQTAIVTFIANIAISCSKSPYLTACSLSLYVYQQTAIVTFIANIAISCGKLPYLTACSLYLYVYQQTAIVTFIANIAISCGKSPYLTACSLSLYVYQQTAIVTFIANIAISCGKSPYLTACSLSLYVYQQTAIVTFIANISTSFGKSPYLTACSLSLYVYQQTAIVTFIANIAISCGYLISCVSGTVSMALTIGPPVIIPFMLFGGFFLNNESVPPYFKWLSYLSWFRYGNEALLVNQWEDIDHIECTNNNITCPKNGVVVLEALNFCQDDFTLDILSLVGLILLFRLLAYLSLLARTIRGQ